MSFWGDKREEGVLNCPAPNLPSVRDLGEDYKTQLHQVSGWKDLF